jgi:hypothetical protein
MVSYTTLISIQANDLVTKRTPSHAMHIRDTHNDIEVQLLPLTKIP